MNAFEAGVVARLKEAGLLDIAERVAKREGLKLADCIAPGDITGAHTALWLVLCKHTSPVRVAEIVAFPEEGVFGALREAGAQLQRSGPALAKAPAPVLDVGAQIEAALAPLRRRVDELESKLVVAQENAARREQEAADLSRKLKAFAKEKKTEERAECALVVDEHLARFGLAANVVREAAARAGSPLDELLSGRSSPAAMRAKGEIVRVLTRDFGMSQPEIGAVLRLNHTSVRAIQRRTGVLPANRGPARKAVA